MLQRSACRTWARVIGVIVSLAAFSADDLSATTWHVDSQSSIQQAIANAQPGDTIIVRNGTYNFPVNINSIDGTADQPITFKAETIGGVVFTGNNMSSNAKMQLFQDHWVIDGFTFDNIKVSGDNSSHRLAVMRLVGASHNVVRNVTINDSGLSSANPHSNAMANAMYLHIRDGSKSNIIERNQFSNNNRNIVVRVGGGGDDIDVQDNVFRYNLFTGLARQETLQLSWGGGAHYVPFRTVVEHNLWKDNQSSSELISSKSSENVFRHNTFENNNDQLTLRAGRNSVVDSNYFINSWGVRAYGEGHQITNNYIEGSFGQETSTFKGGIAIDAGAEGNIPFEVFHNGLVANNTLVNTGQYSFLLGDIFGLFWEGQTMTVAPYGNEILRNLIVNDRGVAIDKDPRASDDNTWLDNYVWSILAGEEGYIPDGVLDDVDPQLLRNAVGNYIATALPGIGADMPYRRLTVDDVGPGSTYVVPEPSTLGLFVTASVLLALRRRGAVSACRGQSCRIT